MRPALSLTLLSSLALLAACADGGSAQADATDAADTSGAADTADAADTAPGDVAADTSTADTGGPEVVTTAATPGARCALADRVGLIELRLESDDPLIIYAYGSVDDRPYPLYGAPELTTDACEFYRYVQTTGCPLCDEAELCAPDGQCVPAPVGRLDAELVLRAGSAEQRVTPVLVTGTFAAQLTLPGATFSLELTFGAARVTLDETALPGDLPGLTQTLVGSYDEPQGIDVTWTPLPAGSDVFTHIPINHHAGGPTFTECRADAATGSLHVGEAMLTPLAVDTGLEFQGVEHMRFAAAETAFGCVEFRFQRKFFPTL